MRRWFWAVALLVLFVFSYGGAQTSVKLPEVSVPSVTVALATAQPPSTTLMHGPTTTVALEPWITSPLTTSTSTTAASHVVLASIESPVVSELEALICDPKWEWSCSEAKAVAKCESQMKPHAVSPPNTTGTRDRGLFQVNSVWREAFGEALWSRILEPEVNVAMAHHIWLTGNRSWLYWTCQP